jgi:TolA-binding protein
VRADAKAAAFYELVRQGKRSELVDAFEVLKKEPLTRTEQSMFGDAVERARAELASQMYQHGLERVRLLRWQEAATAFEDSLRYRDDASSTSVKLGLAQAYRHLNRQRDAILILAPMSESAPDKDLQDDALFELAYCQQEIQAWNDAKTSWRNFIRRFPDHRQVQEAKNQVAQLAALH